MYIWVILSMFLAALYNFNLHYREDVKEITQSPLTEAVASKVIIQHQALQEYMLKQRSTITGNTSQFISIGEDKLKAYAPYFAFNEQKIKSAIFCLDNTDVDTNPYSIDTAVACNATNARYYALTFMQIPQRWYNKKTKEPEAQLKTSLIKLMGLNSTFGYNIIAQDTSGLNDTYISDYEIKNNGTIRSFIPQKIYDSTEYEDFADTCIYSNIPCILQVSAEF